MRQTNQTSVLVIDGTDLTRRGIRDILESQPNICVVAEAARVLDAVELLRSHRPDVVLLDDQLPDGSGLGVCAAIRQLGFNTGILILTNDSDAESIRQYVQQGASGYLLKSASAVELQSAIFDVAAGKMTFSPAVTNDVRALMTSPSGPVQTFSTDKNRLTQRETEVLEQLEYGLRNRDIAMTLGISKRTVETHVRNVLLKLGVSTRTQAVVRTLRT